MKFDSSEWRDVLALTLFQWRSRNYYRSSSLNNTNDFNNRTLLA